jgi:hypothetical protein
VLWSAGIVEPSAGYGSVPSPTAAFQVALTPSISQVGQPVSLTGKTNLQAQDPTAGAAVAASTDAPTTQLSGDSQYNSNMGVVSASK